MTGFLLALTQVAQERMAISIFIAMVYFAVVIIWRPFQTKSHNEILVTGQFVVCVTVIGGYITGTLSGSRYRANLGWMLLVINVGVVFMTFYHQRSERLFSVVDALHAQEDFNAIEVAALWEGAPKITLTSALLEGAAKALMNCEQAEDNDQADLHWQYLVKKLFRAD